MMLKKITLLSLMAVFAAALAMPAFAAEGVQGAVRNVPTTAATALGWPSTPTTVGCRTYSRFGADAGINNNFTACTGIRCLRNYATATAYGAGGFACNGENTVSYNNDANNQPFYMFVDAEMNAGSCNHIGYYAIAGQIASNAGIINTGDFRGSNCPAGPTANNCFDAPDTAHARATPLLNTLASFGGTPNQIASAGGFSPNPTVRVAMPGPGCGAGEARLTWDDPESYAGAMKNGLASPVLGVRLWKNTNSCSSCPTGDVSGWTSIGTFGTTAGATGTCHAISGPSWFATTVRVLGPTNGATELESGIQGGAGFVGANSQCVAPSGTVTRIVRVSARYAGRGTVNVSWTTGVESGVDGYYVQRADSPAGPYTRVSELITPRGESSDYTFGDKVRAGLGHALYYTIQVVNADGTTETSGPTAVNLPASKRKITPGNQ